MNLTEQNAKLRAELKAAKENARYWEDACERERDQRQLETGAQEYRGNTVSHMYAKAKCYGDMVHGCSLAFDAAGFPVDRFAKDGAVGAIARAAQAMAAEIARLRAATPTHQPDAAGEGK